MSILFGGDTGVRSDSLQNFVDGITAEANRLYNGISAAFSGSASGLNTQPKKESSYVDSGFSNVPGTSFEGSQIEAIDDIKKRRITTQQPQLTVYVKKRMFWAFRNEFDPKFMDSGDKLLVRASKLLFERKCSQVAAYEALTKASNLVFDEAGLDATRVELLMELLGDLNEAVDAFVENGDDQVGAVLNNPSFPAESKDELLNTWEADKEKLKKSFGYDKFAPIAEELLKISGKVYNAKQAVHTNWVVDVNNDADIVGTGRGVGVIELTLINNINTSLDMDSIGSFSFSMWDPYNLMKITSDDIEMAINSAISEINDIANVSMAGASDKELRYLLRGPQKILEEARTKEAKLKKIRTNRIYGLTGTSSGPVGGNNIAEVIFEIHPSSSSPRKVVGNLAGHDEIFHKDNFRLILASMPLEQRLLGEEDILVKEIFDLLEEYVSAIENLSISGKEQNEDLDVKYARRNMRLYYLGKSIVQPMDAVHVYLRSNTFKDGEIVGPLSAFLDNSPFISAFYDNAEISDAVLEEEMRQFGIDSLRLPPALYRSLRTGSFLRNAGTHVFGGIVTTVSESYDANSGLYTTNVSGSSNLYWLNMSRVNIKPSYEQPEGVLEDPLTPFDYEGSIDQGTGLISGEPNLLQTNQVFSNSNLLTYPDGPYMGEKATSKNISQDFIPFGDKILKREKHIPGFAYRWKHGITAVTQNINMKTPLDGRGVGSKNMARYMGVHFVDNPFAGLDSADIVSLLVTGYPHSFEAFAKSAQSVGTYTPVTNMNAPNSYFGSFFDIHQSQNKALGNFEPFKPMTSSPEEMAKRLQLQNIIGKSQKELESLQAELAKAVDQFNALGSDPYNMSSPNKVKKVNNEREEIKKAGIESARERAKSVLGQRIAELKAQITTLVTAYRKDLADAELMGFKAYGNDLVLESITSEPDSPDGRRKIKAEKIRSKMMQLRTQVDCKLNTDRNLFIVSDEYEKDLNIQAFIIPSMASQQPDMWRSQYKYPYAICTDVAKTLDFEFICDSQGHIQFRPPRYNKTPLSLLLKLFMLSSSGKKPYPPFLQNLFQSQSASFGQELDTVSRQIRIEELLLYGVTRLQSDKTEYVADEASQADKFINNTLIAAGPIPDQPFAVRNISTEEAAKIAEQVIYEKNELANVAGGNIIEVNEESVAAVAKEIESLQNAKSPNVNSARLVKFNKLADLYSRKQRLVDTKAKIDSRTEALGGMIGGSDKTIINSINKNIDAFMEPFESLVEDDTKDFLGPGSSKRFIITDDQILDYNFDESDQNVFCRYDVTGELDYIGEGPGQIGKVPILWAGATDFDLWRQYGYRSEGPINKPFFKDAELQCAPYAIMLLMRARRNAVRGRVKLYGNEYYQLGDVVYINSRDMLFYVTSVKQSFSYESGSYTTELELRYGRPLGEYLPSPLDVIGQNLIKNQRFFNTRLTSRTTSSKKKGTSLGVILFGRDFDENETPQKTLEKMLSGGNGAYNLVVLQNILIQAAAQVSDGKDAYPKLEVRCFVTDKDDAEQVKRAKQRSEAVRDWFLNPLSKYKENGESSALSEVFPKISPYAVVEFNDDVDPIDIVKINENEQNLARGRVPKDEWWSIIRGPGNSAENADVTRAIDVVLVFQ